MSEDNLNIENDSEPIHLRIRVCTVCAKDETTNKLAYTLNALLVLSYYMTPCL